MPQLAAPEFSPALLLDAFENYAGSITDLDRGVVCGAPALRLYRDELLARAGALGLKAGARVILSVGNGPAFVAALAAILAADGAPLLLHADTPPEELKRFALAFGARFILAEAPPVAAMQAVAADVRTIELSALPDLTWSAVDETDPNFDHQYPEIAGTPLHPTSGTTGKPKIAVRPAEAALADACNYRQTMAVDADDRLLCVVPMSHAYGNGTCVILPLASGASVVAMRKYNPRTVQRALAEHAITIFPAVPAMLDLLLVGAPGGLPHIPRLVLSAGAPLPERTARTFFEKTGANVVPLYGTTETGGISVAAGGTRPSAGACVGPAMAAVDVEIRPVVDAPDLAPGVGRVCVRSNAMMAGYLTHAGIDRSAIVDGWFETGDLGFVDDDERIHLVAREKEVINVFGMKVIPGEVEGVIAAFPQVSDVKVYAGAHRSGSQIVKAAVAAPHMIDLAALKRHCETHLAPYKRPEIVHRLEALPRTPTGKIIKDRLP
ncbi:MAG: class I adenylate-forming enzyme family protein [Planctomycetaceae bacterium]